MGGWAITGSWFSCPEVGVAESITIYLKQMVTEYGPQRPKIKCAIYKKSDNSLVATTEEWTLTDGWDGWKTFSIIWGGALEATDYWLVVWSDTWVYIYYTHETTKGLRKSTVYNSWPDPISPDAANWLHSIYCTYTPTKPKIVRVPTAGVPVPLGVAPILSVMVKALHGNTGMIYVGNAEVSSTNGYVLDAGEPISLDVDNLNDVYIDADVNNEGVSIVAVVK